MNELIDLLHFNLVLPLCLDLWENVLCENSSSHRWRWVSAIIPRKLRRPSLFHCPLSIECTYRLIECNAKNITAYLNSYYWLWNWHNRANGSGSRWSAVCLVPVCSIWTVRNCDRRAANSWFLIVDVFFHLFLATPQHIPFTRWIQLCRNRFLILSALFLVAISKQQNKFHIFFSSLQRSILIPAYSMPGKKQKIEKKLNVFIRC